MGTPQTLQLSVNGAEHYVTVDPDTPLLYVLRNQMGLIGAKLGCGLEQCGACAVLVDGVSTLSCSRPVSAFIEGTIVTIEGVMTTALGKRIEAAFVKHRAGQCGYCIPGIVIATHALLEGNPRPSEDETCTALTPHLCRCGSHRAVLRAVAHLARHDEWEALDQ